MVSEIREYVLIVHSDRMCQMLLQRLDHEWSSRNFQARCGQSLYMMTINAWLRCGDVNREQQATGLLEDLGKKQAIDFKITVECYSLVLNSWGESGKTNAAERAEDLFEKMKEMQRLHHGNTKLMLAKYKTVLTAWSKSSKPHAGARADKIFNRMIELSQNEKYSNLKTDQVTYNT